ncbi:MAG: rhodanese-like domain-containing protein [Clostridium sp.]
MFSLFKRNKINSININELDKILSNIKLIDIRENHETKSGTIKGAKKIPMETLLNSPEKYLNKDDEYHIMCQSGMRSSRTSKALEKQGYKVINVVGGFGSYRGKYIKR